MDRRSWIETFRVVCCASIGMVTCLELGVLDYLIFMDKGIASHFSILHKERWKSSQDGLGGMQDGLPLQW